MNLRYAACGAALALVIGCSRDIGKVMLRPSVSPPPDSVERTFKAGFGREDITPPPGMGIGGYSFEGRQAQGYRHRLFVRAMLLEDANGERVAIVVADLPQVSTVLQRRAAERLAQSSARVGVDRLMLSATHTHAAPGHLYEAAQYNDQAGALPGYDPRWVEFIVKKIVRAVESADSTLVPAKAEWGTVRVPRVTVNRSMDAYNKNNNVSDADSVDDSLVMLRVDQCPTGGECRPAGAFSVFAIHGTGNPALNSLMDGDIHAIVERRLERHVDSLNGEPVGFGTRAIHLFANGTEGDVSPNFTADSRCGTRLEFRTGRRPGGPRTLRAPEEWRMSSRQLRECLKRSRQSVDNLGNILGDSAVALFDRLTLGDSDELTLGRAFTTLDLKGGRGADSLCLPRSGAANFGGAEDGRTRLYKWKFLGVIPSPFEEGGRGRDKDLNAGDAKASCHRAKAIALGFGLQGLLVGKHGFPEFAQLGVMRVGKTLVGFVPWEVTTEAGRRIKLDMRAGDSTGIDRVVLVGLANGYIQYLTTAEEYDEQTYEGGSTLYGPRTAQVVAGHLARLAASLVAGSPIVEVDGIIAYPGDSVTYFAPRKGPAPATIARRIISLSCRDSVLTASWLDAYPGSLIPAAGQLIEIRNGTTVVAWDDLSTVEVRARGGKGRSGYLWEVKWQANRMLNANDTLVLVARPGFGEVVGSCP